MVDIPEDELRSHILNFLKEFKDLMGQGNYYVKDHYKNIQALIELGIHVRLRDELILSIAVEDYSSGPIADEYHDGFFWIFGKILNTVEIYIKLKIVTLRNGDEKAVCLSFHASEYPLNYPFC